ncbi:MAG: hypothetical protein M3R43_04870 [Acidobacteriota bacterium]|nr:hypothetical protein [Acidobacteriota bacterium]
MNLFRSIRKLEQELLDLEEVVSIAPSAARKVLRKVGWISAGITTLAVGIVVGRELRQRYKFSHRTPYDAYAHSGDLAPEVEFGLGI